MLHVACKNLYIGMFSCTVPNFIHFVALVYQFIIIKLKRKPTMHFIFHFRKMYVIRMYIF
jgi:hypothetical protein